MVLFDGCRLFFALRDLVSDVRMEFVVHLNEGSEMVLINLTKAKGQVI